MLSEKQRREEQLSVLGRLKKKGMPERPAEDDMRSMFDLTKDMDTVLEGSEQLVEGGQGPEEVEAKKKKAKKKSYLLEPVE